MPKPVDFVIKHDLEHDNPDDLAQKIFNSIIIKRLKARKPVVCFVGGMSGDGKSWTTLAIQDALMQMQGIDIAPYINQINVYHPLQYPEKKKNILFSKELKKINIMALHEGRLVIRAKHWQSFQAQAVADINALSRSVKRLCVMLVSQNISDITKDVRRTLNFYMTCSRYNQSGAKVHLRISKVYFDDRDIEQVHIRKTKIKGFLVDRKGKYNFYCPDYIEIARPRKELTDAFEKGDTDAKINILDVTLNRLFDEMKKEIGVKDDKIQRIADFYGKKPEVLHTIGKRRKDKFTVKKEFAEMVGIKKEEIKEFEKELNKKLKEAGYFGHET